MTDRAILVTMIEKPENKNAGEVYEKMKFRLTVFNPLWTRTITFDNGKGFAQHDKLAKVLKLKTYLPDHKPLKTKELWKIGSGC